MKYSKIFLFMALIAFYGCGNGRDLNTKISNTTGWNYNDKHSFNFFAAEGLSTTPVGMVPIEGGTFTIGETDEFITAPRNNAHRTISVGSFYMDKYEITNLNWQEYVAWVESVFGKVAPNLVNRVKPDPRVWEDDMAYNDPYIQNYFESTMFSFYPVVGISWEQAMQYCQWRTDRVNEMLLIKAGLINYPDYKSLDRTYDESEKDSWEEEHAPYSLIPVEAPSTENGDSLVMMFRIGYEYIRDKFVFNTDKYYNDGSYSPEAGRKSLYDNYGNERKANLRDGMMVIDYRLPTEAEWEFAAYAPIAGEDGLTTEGKIYPWSGYHPRDLGETKTKGILQANFVRGRGDLMGVSGALNDAYITTAPVDAYLPNDFGLYNMAGNVNEWVLDVYRETTNQEFTEYHSFRGNIFTRPLYINGHLVTDSLGCSKREVVENGDKRDARDGDIASRIKTDFPLLHAGIPSQPQKADPNVDASNDSTDTDVDAIAQETIKYDPTDILTPHITSNSRVYKGGSWNDRVYWLNPSTRRYLEQDQCSNTIGFRCAMSALGDQISPEKMIFEQKKQKK